MAKAIQTPGSVMPILTKQALYKYKSFHDAHTLLIAAQVIVF